MNAFENRINYYELLMTYDDTSKYLEYSLPQGFSFRTYQEGDILRWIDIHLSSGEFTSVLEGEKIFHQFFDSFIDELPKRLVFIIDDKTGEPVGCATISKVNEEGYTAAVDWVAIKKEYQGMKLSRPLISKFISLSNSLGEKKLILHTQTTTWLACSLYLDFNFIPYNTDSIGWNIIKTLTNHVKLKDLDYVSEDIIYNKRNIIIYNKLLEMVIEPFNYEIWDRDNLHSVSVYKDGISYEYEYYLDGDDYILKEVKYTVK